MEEWKIEIRGLEYSNRRFRLGPISYSIKPGTITGIIGKNGSGKSTLLRLMHGDIKPHSGEILVEGKKINSFSALDLSRKMSFLYQEMFEPFSFTVRDVMNVSGYSRDENVASYMEALDELGIVSLADVQFTNLSGGERRLVTIAGSIYQDSDILLLDEPTTYLDVENQLTVHNMIKSLREKGKTIVLVMHEINWIHALCDDVIMLKSGEIIASGPVNECMNGENLKKTFGVPFREVEIESEKLYFHRG